MNSRSKLSLIVVVAVALAAGVVLGFSFRGNTGAGASASFSPTPTLSLPTTSASSPTTPAGAFTPAPAPAGGMACPTATVTVATADELTAALHQAGPGTVVGVLPGTYKGHFVVSGAASASQPSFLCGSAGVVFDGGSIDSSYGLYLNRASYWRVSGITVQDSQKGIVVDNSNHVIIEGNTVQHLGDEGIHLRRNSSDNLVVGNTVTATGEHKAKFGEGVYIGSAVKNWCTYTACQPDRSDRNVVTGNKIYATTAEAVDIKEGTTGGTISDNQFTGDVSIMTGATSWVNVKGNDYQIIGNHGTNAPVDGFTTHVIVAGWGQNNTFSQNVAAVNSSGYGIHVTGNASNTVMCNNVAIGAASGLTNAQCQ